MFNFSLEDGARINFAEEINFLKMIFFFQKREKYFLGMRIIKEMQENEIAQLARQDWQYDMTGT